MSTTPQLQPASLSSALFAALVVLSATPGCPGTGGVTTPEPQDADHDGWTSAQGDCLDDDPTIHPSAEERCDGMDQDCDGSLDEDLDRATWRVDQDGDGYGVDIEACVKPPGASTSARGDCDDGDPRVFPGARDPVWDGRDSDCGGTIGPDPHVGLTELSAHTIQEALDKAEDGQTVWVGAGTYHEHALNMYGKEVALRSTHGEEHTLIDADSRATALVFEWGEGPGSVVDGFTLTHGHASQGGGVHLLRSSPTLTHLTLTGNSATQGGGMFLDTSHPTLTHVTMTGNLTSRGTYGEGGGMYLYRSNPSLIDVTLIGGQSTDEAVRGGGMYLEMSNPLLRRVTLTGNYANHGGGMYLDASSPTLEQVKLAENFASSGGGMYLYNSNPSLTDLDLTRNSARGGYYPVGGGMYLENSRPTLTGIKLIGNSADGGGGLYLMYSNPTLDQTILIGNSATYAGGGMYLNNSSPILTHLAVLENTAMSGGGFYLANDSNPILSHATLAGNWASDPFNGQGGGMYLSRSHPILTHLTVSGNSVPPGDDNYGGGIYLNNSSPTLSHVILSHNSGTDLWSVESAPTLTWCDLYSPHSPSHNLLDLDESNIETDPLFVALSLDGDTSNDNLYLRPGSPLVDAGATDLDGDGEPWYLDLDDQDPDGSRADVGAFSGPGADWSGYADVDEDGLYDSWEVEHGQSLEEDNSASDPDADGATNEEELAAGTDPQVPDSDGDGHEDGAELEAGADPTRLCSRPGAEGGTTLRVPEEYPTIQGAIDAASSGCRIEVGAGWYPGTVEINSKEIELIGVGGHQATTLDGIGEGSVVNAFNSTVTIEGFTITGGVEGEGGGVRLSRVQGTLKSLWIEGNAAHLGGGIYLSSSPLSLSQVTLMNNSASDAGGGIYLQSSDSTIQHATLRANSASNGGGIYIEQSAPVMSQVTLSQNLATSSGGGMYLNRSSPALRAYPKTVQRPKWNSRCLS